MMDIKRIGKRIRENRELRGLTQEGLAEMVDLSTNYISAIERGVKAPRLETFIRIANALNVSSDTLLVDVLITGSEIKASVLYDKIADFSTEEQQKILRVVEVMVNNTK